MINILRLDIFSVPNLDPLGPVTFEFPIWIRIRKFPSQFRIRPVPHSGSGVAPMSSLSGVELLGFWEFGMDELIG